MRSPSIIPGFDIDVYLVLDDFGKLGRAYRETDEEGSDRDTIVRNGAAGHSSAIIRSRRTGMLNGRASGAACEMRIASPLQSHCSTRQPDWTLHGAVPDSKDRRRSSLAPVERLCGRTVVPDNTPHGVIFTAAHSPR
jgi:hypothetical protein